MLHNKCTAECDICSVECSPSCNLHLDLDRVKTFIESCKETTIKSISFTGGEPFLLYEDLLDLVEFSNGLGFAPTAVTNGFWARDYEETYNKLASLRKSGLTHLNVSYDRYHAKYVPIKNINNIAKACNALDMMVEFAIVRTKGEKIGDLVDNFAEDAKVINFLVAQCEPAGYAGKRLPEEAFFRNYQTDHLACPYHGIVNLCYDGRIFPCCSHFVFETNLTIGNYKDMLMPEVLHKIRNNCLLYVLRNYGFDPFIEMRDGIVDRDERVSSPCELCARFFGDDLTYYVEPVKEFLKQIKSK